MTGNNFTEKGGQSEQKPLGLIGEVQRIQTLNEAELTLCNSFTDALRRTVYLAPGLQKSVAIDLDLRASHFSQILEGCRYLPSHKTEDFFRVCKNVFALQWLAWKLGFRLIPRELTKDEQIELLQKQLQEKTG